MADTEAHDEYFAKKFTDGSKQQFLELCQESVAATDRHLNAHRQEHPHAEFVATSFLDRFGNSLPEVQDQYSRRLVAAYSLGKLARVDKDIEHRMNLYHQMYGPQVDYSFLVDRTVRTMAQYLALGELIGSDQQSCIIVHDTVNASFFQDANRYPDSGNVRQLPTSPVINRDVRVYS